MKLHGNFMENFFIYFQDDQNAVLVSKIREYPCIIQDRKPTMEI